VTNLLEIWHDKRKETDRSWWYLSQCDIWLQLRCACV